VLIAALQETKLTETLRELFARAKIPSRVYAGVVQQNGHEFGHDALEELCTSLGTPLELKLSLQHRRGLNKRQEEDGLWGQGRYTHESLQACKPAANVRMYRMDSKEAKGPAYAMARQPLLLSQGDAMEDFCLQIDAHSVFVNHWDDKIIQQWASTENEYAILSTYPTNAQDINAFGEPNNANNHWEMPHMCSAEISGTGLVHNLIAGAAANLKVPCFSKLWAAGMSFGRCHAERDVPNDPALMHIFTGEEFGRGARLWTNGYDFYTPTRPVIGTWYGGEKGGLGDWEVKYEEEEAANHRLKLLLATKEHELSQEQKDSLRGYSLGSRRSFADYIKFTGVDTIKGTTRTVSCLVDRWHPWDVNAQPAYEMLKGSPMKQGRAVQSDGSVAGIKPMELMQISDKASKRRKKHLRSSWR